jgi:DNA-binding MarR family transcriptional regulator
MTDRPRRGGGFLLLDLHYAGRLANRLLEEEFERIGARFEWAGLLTEIRTVEPVTMSELGQRTGLPQATLYDYVERLQVEGLVAKEPNPADGRSYFLRVTPDGLTEVRASSDAVRAAHDRFRAMLDRPVAEVEAAVTDLRFALEESLNERATL